MRVTITVTADVDSTEAAEALKAAFQTVMDDAQVEGDVRR